MSSFACLKKQQMRAYFLLSIIFSFFFTSIQAQKKINEKEYALLQNEIRRLAVSYPDSALLVADRLEKAIDFEQKIFAKGSIAYLTQIKGDTLKSNKKIKEALELTQSMSNSDSKYRSLAYLNNYMGLIDRQRGKLTNALLKFRDGIEFSKKVNDVKQIIKLEMNIAVINDAIENYNLAIKSFKRSDQMIKANNFLFTETESLNAKSNLYLGMGKSYESIYKMEIENKKNLDSAMFFYKKALSFSKYSPFNKIKIQNNIAGLFLELNQFDKAVALYQNVISECSENNLNNEFCGASYNLGYTFFLMKRYDKSLVYFNKVDSIYSIDKSRLEDYTKSKYYQSKIYEFYKDYDKASDFASLYLDNLEKGEIDLIEEKEKINNFQNDLVLKNEMIQIQGKYKNQLFLKKVGLYMLLIVFVVLIYLAIKNYKNRKRAEANFNAIIEKYKRNEEAIEFKKILNESYSVDEKSLDIIQDQIPTLNLDEEKEIQILKKLKDLEDKKVFLNQDFTLQFVAKKIKTNTTYLSYVVNKNFEKTFSEYVNELKISYVINEMIVNSLYRKYSTQAIAESVGYKNAASFARSFNKKTGLSPVQFAQKLEKSDIFDI